VTAFVLFSCCFTALTTPTIGASKQNSIVEPLSYEPRESQALSFGDVILLDENFTDGNMPPKGYWGDWERQQTNVNQTWYIDSTAPYTKPYCGTVHRDGSPYLQDEWLITPSLNFSKYLDISLKFHWYACYYVTVYKRFVELNISVSTDGGGNWTNIWSFDDVDEFFTDWTWQDSILPDNDAIDLSAYAGEKDVKIAFQYHSNTTASAEEQEFSIDDITVYGASIEVNKLECKAGGPYEWWWPMQYEYYPIGVRFHGNVTNGTLLTQWFWDFGDGNTSVIPYNPNPIHFYSEIGTFNVTLTVKDNTTTPPRIAFNYTTVKLFLLKPPEIDITAQPISVGIQAKIINDGVYNASYVDWRINISWGLLQIRQKPIANGTIENIAAGTSATIRSKLYFFGFGIIHVILTAYPENLPGIIKHYNGLKIGPLVFIFKET
jgi:hypothetical protein